MRLVAHKPSDLPLAANVRFTEDTVEMKLGDSPLWRNASRLRPYRLDILDVRQGVAASQAIVEESGMPVMLMLRLKISGQTENRRSGDAGNQEQDRGIHLQYRSAESRQRGMLWMPGASQRNSREEAIKIAELYPAGLKAGSFVTVDTPFAADAYRFENGQLMAGPGCTFRPGCENIKAQKIPTLSGITYRVAAVDEDLGIVLLRLDFGPGSTRVAGRLADGLGSFQSLWRPDPRSGSVHEEHAAVYAVRLGFDERKVRTDGAPAKNQIANSVSVMAQPAEEFGIKGSIGCP